MGTGAHVDCLPAAAVVARRQLHVGRHSDRYSAPMSDRLRVLCQRGMTWFMT